MKNSNVYWSKEKLNIIPAIDVIKKYPLLNIVTLIELNKKKSPRNQSGG